MGFRILCLLCIVLSATWLAHGAKVFEFGNPELPGTILLAHTKGSMGLLEHIKHIQLYVPPCYMPTFVQVEVKNLFSTPDVDYNSRRRTVTIHYKSWQSSQSSYTIRMRGVLLVGCRVY